MSRPIRLIVTDMDGTLLDPDKQITARTVEAVRAARKQGVAVTICSGRIHTMMENYLPALPVEGLYLAANGAVIADAGTGAIVWGAPIQENEVAALLDWAAARNYDVGVMAAGACYFLRDAVCMGRFEAYNQMIKPQGFSGVRCRILSPGEVPGEPVYKILACEEDESRHRAMADYIATRPSLSDTVSEPGLLDISAAGVDKGSGLRRLMELMGVEREEVCTFGDYFNDLPMLREAGLAVAMGNACDAVKACAHLVAPANDEDGVAQVIESHILI